MPPGTRADSLTPKSAVLVLLSLFCLALPACQRNAAGTHPDYLQLRLTNNPTTLDPALITDKQGGEISAKIYNGLVRFNENLELVPDLARSWRLSEDNRTYVFSLRRGVTFSNGREVTAEDFRYSFERVLAPKTKAPITWVLDKIEGSVDYQKGLAKNVAGIRVIDRYTLSLSLAAPFGPFLSLLAMPTAYVVPREEVDRLGQDFGAHPLGTGPFALTEWRHGQSLTLSARQDYFAGAPRLKGIQYRVIPEDLTAVMEFETGSLDALLIPAAEYRRYATDSKWERSLYGRPGLNSYYLGLNCTRPPFNDQRVRQAVNLAIDRERILNTIFEKRGILAAGPVPRGLWKNDFGPSPGLSYPYGPERAKKLIQEAGAVGAPVTIYISADNEILDIMEVIADYLSKAGLRAQIRQLDWSAFKSAVNLGEPDAFWLSWWADYPDPENFLFPLFHSASVGPAGNRTRCLDPELDRLIDLSQRTMNEKKRYRLYRQAEDRVIKNAPWIFMWHRADYYIVQERVKNFRIYPIYSIDKGLDIELSPLSSARS